MDTGVGGLFLRRLWSRLQSERNSFVCATQRSSHAKLLRGVTPPLEHLQGSTKWNKTEKPWSRQPLPVPFAQGFHHAWPNTNLAGTRHVLKIFTAEMRSPRPEERRPLHSPPGSWCAADDFCSRGQQWHTHNSHLITIRFGKKKYMCNVPKKKWKKKETKKKKSLAPL